jgi:lysylphosphatidylglycerol synthetase-like protein (DUF2156 family)
MTNDLDRADLVRRWGGPVSGALFDPETKVFRVDGIDGAIAYRKGLGCAVAIGDPVCAPDDKARLADAFREMCHQRRWRVVYAVAGELFASSAERAGYAAIEFARELIVDPRVDATAGHAAQTLRGKVHRATHAGVVVAEHAPDGAGDAELERDIERAVFEWRHGRRGLQIYLTPFAPFAGRACKRWFYARRAGRVVGLFQMLRLEAAGGYLLSQLIATPDAPPGTTELLGVTGLRALGAEGCAYATWGPAPLAELGRVTGLGSLSEKLARAVFRNAGRAFHLEARNAYRRKFPVARTSGSYLLFDPPRIGPATAIETLRAFHASRAHAL